MAPAKGSNVPWCRDAINQKRNKGNSQSNFNQQEKRWDTLAKAVEETGTITMVVDEAEDVDAATEVAVDAEEATTPAPVLTKGRPEINFPSKPKRRPNTSKFLPTGDLQAPPSKGGIQYFNAAPQTGTPIPGSVFVPVANRPQCGHYDSQNSTLCKRRKLWQLSGKRELVCFSP